MDLELIRKLELVHLNGSIYLYMSKKEIHNNFDFYFSDNIDDYYWNFVTNLQLSNVIDFNKIWSEIKNISIKNNRQPILYLTPTSNMYKNKNLLGLKNLFTDSWLILRNLKDYPQYKSELDIIIKEVDNSNINDFVEAVSEGFSSDDPNDPYHGLSEGYRTALKNSINKSNNNYEIKHFIVKYNNEVVGTITINNDNEVACLYNITTKKKYKKKGICKETISYIVNYLYQKGIKIVCLQTESGFYTEQVYLKLGFEKIFEGYGYGE